MPKNKPLSQEIKSEIKRLHSLGFNGKQIAKKLNISRSVAYKYLPSAHKPWKRWDEDQIQILIDYYALGKSPKIIAKKLGRNENQVKIKMCRYRRAVRADPKKRQVLKLLTFGFKHGATPGQVIHGIRYSNILGRVEDYVL